MVLIHIDLMCHCGWDHMRIICGSFEDHMRSFVGGWGHLGGSCSAPNNIIYWVTHAVAHTSF